MPMSLENRAKASERMKKMAAARKLPKQYVEPVEDLVEQQSVDQLGTSEAPCAVLPAIEAPFLVHPAIPVKVSDPARIGSREVNLVVKTDGTMVSLYGPCVCGASKREWHPICLKQS